MKQVINSLIEKIEHDIIINTEDERISRWSKLRSSNTARESSKSFLVEGVRAIEWFMRFSDFSIESLILSCDEINKKLPIMQERVINLIEEAVKRQINIIEVNREVLRKISDFNKPKGIIAIAKHSINSIADLLDKVKAERGIAISLIDINDPGNVGTIIRSGVAFGALALFSLEGSVDPYNPKVLRASTGHIIPSIRGRWKEFYKECKKRSIEIIGLDVKSGMDIKELEKFNYFNDKPIAICIGSEGMGIPHYIKGITHVFQISMSNKAESLNVGVAASIMLWLLSSSSSTRETTYNSV